MTCRLPKPAVTGFAAFLALAFFLVPAAVFGKADHREVSFGVIAEKDLFRPSRNNYRQPKAVSRQSARAVVMPLPKSPPPRLTLSGTILLDSGNEALMSLQSAPSGSGIYRVGDQIEGFVITDILGESVLLKREDEVLKVHMDSGQGGFQDASSFERTRRNIAVQSGQPAGISPALVPRRLAPFQRAFPENRERKSEWEDG